jgi:hypothetical protein
LRNLVVGDKLENADKFKTWGIDSDIKFFALYLQNKLHNKNSVRRESFAQKKYKNPWTEADDFIQGFYGKLVEDEKSKKITEFHVQTSSSASSASAQAFAYSRSPEEAAGALLGAKLGVNITFFYNQLLISKSKIPKPLITMLVKGNYLGVKLLADAECWIPRRHIGNELWRAYPKCMTPEEWKDLIPSLSYRFISGEVF